MTPRDIQRLLTAGGYYAGGIDGRADSAAYLTAVDRILRANVGALRPGHERWSAARRGVAAGQLVLAASGHAPGQIDGLAGVNTAEALAAYDHATASGRTEVVPRRPAADYTPVRGAFPRQKDCPTFYGKPGPAVVAQLVKVQLPFPFRIDWALSQKVSTFSLHARCADSARSALARIASHYGETEMRKLGLDRFAGSYNHRKMRGGTSWSMHAYGCAIDFYAGPNGLRVPAPEALFSGKVYAPFFDIWEEHGWTSLGRTINRDWMHVQAASL